MRRVAGELGVGTMSLYRYVPGKGELLDLMLDHVNGVPDDAPDPRSLSWRRTLDPEVARLLEDAFAISGREALEFGLRALLDGLESFLAARARG